MAIYQYYFWSKINIHEEEKNTFHYGGRAVELWKYQVRKFLRQIKSYHYKNKQEYSLKGKHILVVCSRVMAYITMYAPTWF